MSCSLFKNHLEINCKALVVLFNARVFIIKNKNAQKFFIYLFILFLLESRFTKKKYT